MLAVATVQRKDSWWVVRKDWQKENRWDLWKGRQTVDLTEIARDWYLVRLTQKEQRMGQPMEQQKAHPKVTKKGRKRVPLMV